MPKPITPAAEAIHHDKATRPYIPTGEEAGTEDSSDRVAERPAQATYARNPVVERGQDPEIFWKNKYGPDDQEDQLKPDIRSLYRHEHVSPELLLNRLRRPADTDPANPASQGDFLEDLFGPTFQSHDELDKPSDYYKHGEKWTNRLIQGDSLTVMTSLVERESMTSQVQCVFFDPPYGIKYNSNWQMKINSRDVTDGKDEHLTAEPEQIKAFRDTWEDGIHSYLSYLRDRLLVAKELLTQSGSCFVQISDENVHLVRCLMDEVFGSQNFVSQIGFQKTTSATNDLLASTSDYLIWYAKNKAEVKYRQLYTDKTFGGEGASAYGKVLLPDGTKRALSKEERSDISILPKGAKIYRIDNLTSQRPPGNFPVEFQGKRYVPKKGYWKTGEKGFANLIKANRIEATDNAIYYVRFLDDFPVFQISNSWTDTTVAGFASDKNYVVETSQKVIQRCILMTTDPGDLVLDPTCGSGTTAFVAEQWGRRWITIDTSRIALNLARTRLTTAVYPWYSLYDEEHKDIRLGFQYRTVPHITLKSLANNEPAPVETLYDQPIEDKTRMRVSGPFTVETLQADTVSSAADLEQTETASPKGQPSFFDRVFAHLTSNGLRTGIRQEQAILSRIEALPGPALHAAGYFATPEGGERKVYLHIGPQFAAVSKQAVNQAVIAARRHNDADWLVILGFAFDSDLVGSQESSKQLGKMRVDMARMHDDLLQEGLTKKNDKKAASFVILGEPDIDLMPSEDAKTVQVRINGLDIYDPMADQLKPRSRADIAYWTVDDEYDESRGYVTRQLFFCGGDKKEFAKWERKLSDQVKIQQRQKIASQLRLVIDEDAFDRLYGFESHPIPATPGRRLAIRIISQFGEECTRVLSV